MKELNGLMVGENEFLNIVKEGKGMAYAIVVKTQIEKQSQLDYNNLRE